MKKFTAVLALVFIFAVFSCVVPSASAEDVPTLFGQIGQSFDEKNTFHDEVYLGGYPLGLTLDGEGVVVVGLHEFINDAGAIVCPAHESGLQIGDRIVEINGKPIFNSSKIIEYVNVCDGKPILLSYVRSGDKKTVSVLPQFELANGVYKIGLYTRDSSSGIGTLTYIKKDNSFGCLGHPVCDLQGNVAGNDGGVFFCNVNEVVKGEVGAAGELRGTFSFADKLGKIYANTKLGVFGSFTAKLPYDYTTVSVAHVNEVKPGKAFVFCTLDDNKRCCYEAEIVKASQQTMPADRGLVVKITDEKLLSKTGGIVQGMSGSPIVQNGKLVGAVTHVFVNDPTRGYGVYAEWMLKN